MYVKTFRTKVKKAMRPSREHVKQSIKEFRSLIDWIFTHDDMLLSQRLGNGWVSQMLVIFMVRQPLLQPLYDTNMPFMKKWIQ